MPELMVCVWKESTSRREENELHTPIMENL